MWDKFKYYKNWILREIKRVNQVKPKLLWSICLHIILFSAMFITGQKLANESSKNIAALDLDSGESRI